MILFTDVLMQNGLCCICSGCNVTAENNNVFSLIVAYSFVIVCKTPFADVPPHLRGVGDSRPAFSVCMYVCMYVI